MEMDKNNVGAIMDRPQDVASKRSITRYKTFLRPIPYNVTGYKPTERDCFKTDWDKHPAKIVPRSHHTNPRGLRRTFSVYL